MARYGVANGQNYVPADGSKGLLIVVDAEKHADCDDVVVYDMLTKQTNRIDAFKLAKCRYSLVRNNNE